MKRRHFMAGALAALPVPALAQAGRMPPLRIGVLTDFSSPAADVTGLNSVEATKMAVEDMGGQINGRAVEVLSADFQNKPDVGAAITRKWIDEQGVDAISDVPNSAVALAVASIVWDKRKTFLAVATATSALTGPSCNPTVVQWVHDSWSMATPAKAVTEEGGKSWFFITADYAFGHDLEEVATRAIRDAGGNVIGKVLHPVGAPDFASYLLQAQASGAQVIGIASTFDAPNIIKQVAEFGMNRNPAQKIVMLTTTINEIESAGLDATQGLLVSTPFYWDQDEASRSFARRLQKRTGRQTVTQNHAGDYACTLHYLKAVAALGASSDGPAVVERMKAMPTDDPLFKKGVIRADGRKVHPVSIYQVKSPAEQHYPQDDLTFIRSLPADQAFRPMAQDGCPFLGQT